MFWSIFDSITYRARIQIHLLLCGTVCPTSLSNQISLCCSLSCCQITLTLSLNLSMWSWHIEENKRNKLEAVERSFWLTTNEWHIFPFKFYQLYVVNIDRIFPLSAHQSYKKGFGPSWPEFLETLEMKLEFVFWSNVKTSRLAIIDWKC